MFKSASILVLLAFALGLWIGFNPQAHASAQKAWEQGKTSLAKLEVQIKTGINQTPGGTGEKSTPPSAPPRSSETPDLAQQVQTALKQLAVSLEQIWNELITRARTA